VQALLLSGIGVVQVEQRGYRTVESRAELERIGFTAPQRRVPALLIPLHGVHGEIAGYQIRPDTPRQDRDGKVVKYETPGKSRMVLDVPPTARGKLGDPATPLFITEGVKKADSAVTRGLCCVALLGVWNWRGTNADGGKVALVEWDSIALNGRAVYVVFDSDVTVKSSVHAAMARLKAYLEHRGATVRVVYLPGGEGGAKVGLDDFFVAGHDVDELLSHATDTLRAAPLDPSEQEPPYRITDEGIFGRSRDGEGWAQLTNFSARIVADKLLDDGIEERRTFSVETRLGARSTRFDVPAAEFDDLRWVAEHVGAGATVFAVRNAEKHVRAAIQSLTGLSATQVRAIAHTGWANVGGGEVFVHRGGAIGELGAVSGVEVALEEALDPVELPVPPDRDGLRRAVRAVLSLLDVAPVRISAVVMAASLRAVIGPCDFAIHLAGASGVFKTALAAISQQFFGRSFSGHRLPANWTWTANSIEALAFAAKDIVMVVDDFAPAGGTDGLRKLQEVSDRLFRNQGNNAGRGRCATDGSLRRTKHPRGLLISSGEDVPRGSSIRARVFIVHVAQGDVDRGRLTAAQTAGDAGEYASAMAGFVRFLAARRAATTASLSARVREIRGEMAADGVHRRTPGICADLLFGVETFVGFAVAAGVLDGTEARAVIDRVRAGLVEAIDVQRSDQTEAEPAERFLALLQSALLSGEAHVCGRDGRHPPEPSPWGWARLTGVGEPLETDSWAARGRCVGWLDGEDLYLDQDAAVRAVCVVGAQSGDPIAVTPGTIARRLRDRGLLRASSADGKHLKVQVSLAGARRWVLHLDAAVVLGVPSGPAATTPGAAVAPETSSPSGPSADRPDDDWECPRCGGSDAWVSRVNGDRRCRSCVPPAPGAELVGPTSSSFGRGGASS
jgi:hypothetical protein